MTSRMLRLAGPLILLLAALAALILGLLIGGGAAPRVVSDPGAAIRWGLPVVKLLVNLSAATMVGGLVVAVFALRAGEREFDLALDLASASAAVFTVTSGVTGFLTFVSTFNPEVSAGPAFGEQLGRYLTETELGRVWLISTIAAALITVLAFAVRNWVSTLATAVLAIAALVPMATQGHSGTLANHDAAVMALILHVIGATVWLGGLVTLVVLRPVLTASRVRTVVERYSTLALASFTLVGVSGVARMLTSITDPRELLSPYGALLGVKAAALLALGVVGVLYRRRLVPRMTATGGGAFWAIVAAELAIMGIASGAAAALARTPAPADVLAPALTTAAEILTEAPLPPELTPLAWLTAWDPDLLWAVAAAAGIFFYLAGVRRLRRTGRGWPPARTAFWICGAALLFWTTSGPIAAYGDYLHSMNMLSRILLLLVVPPLLVLGAPHRLAVEAIQHRNDGSRGIREWLQVAADSRVLRILRHPAVATVAVVATLWGVGATRVLPWTLVDPLGHEWLIAQSLTAGSLLTWSVLAARARPVSRFGGLVAVVVAVIALGLWNVLQPGLAFADWFGAMGRSWGPSALEDQRVAGFIAAIGVIPFIPLVAVGRRTGQRPVISPSSKGTA
ncbi:cytochrome c oxidase assembly protein [Microbacterium oryzae]|uniref:Copper transporter n=1 Tax=Microbacterium oryzae TaxID=743009 RepID=A0A6I6E7R9_9MICO|nr:cytochrome c oxidase assembly protein [Microbacterium oryzae]QGU27691.1 copper transporter [Microbacterium oryzae]